MEWNREFLRNNDNLQCVTNTGEVFLLARKENGDSLGNGKKVKRGYAIYKLVNYANGDPQAMCEAYVMALENDFAPSLYNPPILLTEDQVLEFLNFPENAATYAFNEWLNCYR